MYITPEAIETIVRKYGRPRTVAMTAPVSPKEYDFIKSTQKHGRRHDATFYIFKGPRVIVIAKHYYPDGLYRAPSGGVNPGEDMETGIKREAYEETGTRMEIEKYLMRIDVDFTDGARHLPWDTYIFRCRHISGELKPIDTREIRDVRLADLSEFDRFRTIIAPINRGGLAYRARLHDAVKELL
jgi:8-oxo-dGTP pyrophosphatase MutT (NUDIX family)